MTIAIAAIGKPRRIPPPLPCDGGGFWYVRRDGAILLDADGDYVRFDDAAAAQSHVDLFHNGEGEPRWMPKQGTH